MVAEGGHHLVDGEARAVGQGPVIDGKRPVWLLSLRGKRKEEEEEEEKDKQRCNDNKMFFFSQ